MPWSPISSAAACSKFTVGSLARLRQLSAAERGFLFQAACALPIVDLALPLLGFVRLRSLLSRDVSSTTRRTGGPRRGLTPEAQARLIAVAARRGPWRVGCLRESLLLWWLLRRRGADAELRVGVREAAGGIAAHAWVELDGRPLNDRPDVASRYAPFAGDVGSTISRSA